jgi:hypothetical protein
MAFKSDLELMCHSMAYGWWLEEEEEVLKAGLPKSQRVGND